MEEGVKTKKVDVVRHVSGTDSEMKFEDSFLNKFFHIIGVNRETILRSVFSRIPFSLSNLERRYLDHKFEENKRDIAKYLEKHFSREEDLRWVNPNNVKFISMLGRIFGIGGYWDPVAEIIKVSPPRSTLVSKVLSNNGFEDVLVHEMFHNIGKNSIFFSRRKRSARNGRHYTMSQQSGLSTTHMNIEFGNKDFFGSLNEALTEYLTTDFLNKGKKRLRKVSPSGYKNDIALLTKILESLSIGEMSESSDGAAVVVDSQNLDQYTDTYKKYLSQFVDSYFGAWSQDLKKGLRVTFGEDALKILSMIQPKHMNKRRLRKKIIEYFSYTKYDIDASHESRHVLAEEIMERLGGEY